MRPWCDAHGLKIAATLVHTRCKANIARQMFYAVETPQNQQDTAPNAAFLMNIETRFIGSPNSGFNVVRFYYISVEITELRLAGRCA